TDGSFTAFITRAHGSQLLFVVNPAMTESNRLYRPVSRTRWGSAWAVVSQFAPGTGAAGSVGAWEERDRLRIPAYTMEVGLTEAANANLDFTGSALMTMTATEPVGPWLLFQLEPKLGI